MVVLFLSSGEIIVNRKVADFEHASANLQTSDISSFASPPSRVTVQPRENFCK